MSNLDDGNGNLGYGPLNLIALVVGIVLWVASGDAKWVAYGVAWVLIAGCIACALEARKARRNGSTQ